MILLTAALIVAQAASPSPSPSPAGPVATVETSLGRIRIALDQERTPVSVANFVKYARAGHYAGTVFHRVMPGFMVQGGGMTVELKEKPTSPPIRNEARDAGRNLRGTVAMARTNDANSATAQFFINLKDNPFLDFGIQGAGYAVFGHVIDGMDVVDKIGYMEGPDASGKVAKMKSLDAPTSYLVKVAGMSCSANAGPQAFVEVRRCFITLPMTEYPPRRYS